MILELFQMTPTVDSQTEETAAWTHIPFRRSNLTDTDHIQGWPHAMKLIYYTSTLYYSYEVPRWNTRFNFWLSWQKQCETFYILEHTETYFANLPEWATPIFSD